MAGLSVLVLNGPNLNMLGVREPDIYGADTLSDIEAACLEAGTRCGLEITCRQSNLEGEMISAIHACRDHHDGLIINAAAYAHTSIALHDALRLLDHPIIEVHLSNTYRREAFRHHSYVAACANGVIAGLGVTGYVLAIEAMRTLLRKDTP